MFTGLIREKAKVIGFVGDLLKLQADYHPKIGDSVAVNGVCLTVVSVEQNSFSVELSPETKNRIALENYREEVHIEPAMRVGDRLEGHIVQGHVDTIGTVEKIIPSQKSYDFHIGVDPKFIKFIAPKGSIAIDGVSLTVNDVYTQSFRLTVIPHTVKETLFQHYKIGTRVNIETDMFARYLYHMFGNKHNYSWDEVDAIMARF